MLTIDGTRGEGGGQILRTSLALSILTQRPFRIHSIRARRSRPGLQPQHLAAVKAAAAVGCAELRGAQVGSLDLTFVPAGLAPGEHRFVIGTAGSAPLVLQTVLPALLHADAPSRLIIEGATHNTHAPPFEFLDRVVLPLVSRLGASASVTLDRHGFYPKGGGRITADIAPWNAPRRLDLHTRGRVLSRRGAILLSRLPLHIAQREIAVLAAALDWPESCFSIDEITTAFGPGNAVILDIECEHAREVVSAIGQRGRSAEDVAAAAADEARRYLAADVPVGEHLADQLVLLLAVAAGGSFTTLTPTLHTTTNIDTIRLFLDRDITVADLAPGRTRIDVA